MTPIRLVILLLAAPALSPATFAEVVSNTLSLEVSRADISHSVEFSTGGSASAHPGIRTLYLTAAIEWDTETLQTLNATFYNSSNVVGGGVRWDDYEMSVDTRLNPPDLPAFDSNWKFSFKGVTVLVGPDIQKLAVANERGDLDAKLYLYRGTATVDFSSFGETISESFDYSNGIEEISLAKPPRVRIERLPDTLMSTGVAFHFDFEFYEKATERSSELGTTITTIDQGAFTLTGTLVTPTRFANWAPKAGEEFADLERGAVSSLGVPMELAWALNLNMRDLRRHRHPLNLVAQDGIPTLMIAADSLNEDIFVEYSLDLRPDSWTHVPDAWLAHGLESLKAGARAPIAVRLPASEEPLFLRVRPSLTNLLGGADQE